MSKREVVFVDGTRTAFGRMGGTLREFTAEQLAGIGIKGLVEKTKIKEKGKVDSVFLGSAAHCSRAMNPARWALLYAGLPYETSASYIEMQCGSAIDSINHAAWKILADQADVVIAGGMESYSNIPAKFSMSTPPYRLIPPMPMAPELSPVPEECIGMGITAENLQKMYNIPRQASDEFALRSQVLAKKAMDAGYFVDEIIPVMVPQGKKQPPLEFKVDEHPRMTSMEALAALPPAFTKDGTVTAGNASGRNDGSAFVLMMTAEKAKELGYKPMARWLAGADYGCDPKIMGIAPAYAMPMAIKRAGLKLSDMDVMECNEAFAVQNLAVIKEIEKQTGEKIDMDKKWNPNGGAIAFGHPNGASGARICMFTMRELIRRGGRYGIFGSCCGGGLGVATVIENLQK
ncbi:MAG TPA: thiolase family protein [Smithellaceae bacterium]|nr:thiolase family protein [Smithellaceae bacterium]HRS89764.1 thiolase family protein [Smithellaceae bacterium]HRV26621.1 thiolase family protein [Smithellaceae bacterium]